MMKARDQQTDPMKSPRLVTMLALAFGAVEETPGEEVERVYRTNIFRLLHVTEQWRTVRVSPRGETV
jgi:hypothetical protein